ncbi:MAG TPA: dihydrofolate synthase [Bacteroidales bacterium]|nr:dihydrofolate synthase [Bacteroidales bacterium]
MTYKETLEYLYSQLPMFHRIGPAAYKANLDNTHALSNHLGNPEKQFKTIHIAGTNGKGSVSNMLASILQEHGMKTGLATSPHLRDFRERIRINGKMIPKIEIAKFVTRHKDFFQTIQPSFFEISIALTFDYFARQKVDIAIIETGLGGRLDSTNIITPELSIITNIGMDHVNLLGDTLDKIAGEKAGIIKYKTPVVIGRDQPEIFQVFSNKAQTLQAPLYKAWEMYCPKGISTSIVAGKPMQNVHFNESGSGEYVVATELMGRYQQENLAAVLSALKILSLNGKISVDPQTIERGLANISKNTGFMGRWQMISKRPRIVCDTAHNVDGVKLVIDQLLNISHKTLRIVFGMVDDKDITNILSLLPVDAQYYFCKPNIPRGLDPAILAKQAAMHGLKGAIFESVSAALKCAKHDASPNDLIYVGGSTFVVAEVV